MISPLLLLLLLLSILSLISLLSFITFSTLIKGNCISIHKSQGSEFPHVLIPISRIYHNMLYNKLIYTGVSRAKRSLILIGEPDSLIMAIHNEYSTNRQTNLKEELINAIGEE